MLLVLEGLLKDFALPQPVAAACCNKSPAATAEVKRDFIVKISVRTSVDGL